MLGRGGGQVSLVALAWVGEFRCAGRECGMCCFRYDGLSHRLRRCTCSATGWGGCVALRVTHRGWSLARHGWGLIYNGSCVGLEGVSPDPEGWDLAQQGEADGVFRTG